jgi:hypothetical protein
MILNFMRSFLAWIYQTSFSSNYPDSKIDRAYKLWDLLNWSIIWTCCNGRHRSCVVGMGSRVLTQSPNLNCPNIWNEQLKIRSTFGVNRTDWLTDFECLVLYSIPANISLVFEAIWVLQRGENSKLSYWYLCEQIISEIDSHSVLLEVQPSMNIINWNALIDVMAECIQEMILRDKSVIFFGSVRRLIDRNLTDVFFSTRNALKAFFFVKFAGPPPRPAFFSKAFFSYWTIFRFRMGIFAIRMTRKLFLSTYCCNIGEF